MSYLHSKKIVFRDLKPANVGFDSSGVLKLFDFGFVIGIEGNSEKTGESHLLYDRCGTPWYMAPEVGLESGTVSWPMSTPSESSCGRFAYSRSHSDMSNWLMNSIRLSSGRDPDQNWESTGHII